MQNLSTACARDEDSVSTGGPGTSLPWWRHTVVSSVLCSDWQVSRHVYTPPPSSASSSLVPSRHVTAANITQVVLDLYNVQYTSQRSFNCIHQVVPILYSRPIQKQSEESCFSALIAKRLADCLQNSISGPILCRLWRQQFTQSTIAKSMVTDLTRPAYPPSGCILSFC